MKILFLIFFVVLSFGFKSDKQIIEGYISTKNSGNVFLLDGNDTLATTALKKGKFKFKREVTAPSVYTLSWGVEKNESCVLFLEGDNLKIDATQEGVVVAGGGALQQQWEQFKHKENQSLAKRAEILVEYEKAKASKNLFASRVVRAMDEKNSEQRDSMESDYIRSNDNLLGAYLVKRRIRELIKQKKVTQKYELLGETARKTTIGKDLYSYYESDRMMKVGLKAPDFTLPMSNGTNVSLYSVKSKVKIVDFWASWCGPCRAANPDVIALYEKYHSRGLEIIGVSLDTDIKKWEQAVAADKLPWIHVSSLKAWDCPTTVAYGIKGIPAIIVVDENNKIVSINPNKGELEEILSKML